MGLPIISDILNSISGVINTYNLTSKEKEQIKADMNNILIQHYDKIAEIQRDIISSETQGNWLQRSWRPIVMLSFSAIVVLGIFVDIPLLKEDSPFWDLLQFGLGGNV